MNNNLSNNLKLRFLSSITLGAVFAMAIFTYRPLFTTITLILAALMLAEWFDMTKSSRLALLSGLIVIPFPMIAIVYISYLDNKGWVLFTLALTISMIDMCAMFGGKFFKGPKLAPKISPQKTVSGLFSAIFAAGLTPLILSLLPFYDLHYLLSKDVSTFTLSFSSAILALIAQASDLFISMFKRKFQIKDTGSIIPGHGGILDRFDSYIFAAPIVLIFIISNL